MTEVSEAIGALKGARRGILAAIDDVGDAACSEREGKDGVFGALQDRLTDIEHSLSVCIEDLRKARASKSK